jgi:hypothetical protein
VELNPLTAFLNSDASLGVVIVSAIVLVLTSAIRHLSKMDHRLVRALVAMRIVRALRPKNGEPVSPDAVERILKALSTGLPAATERADPSRTSDTEGDDAEDLSKKSPDAQPPPSP